MITVKTSKTGKRAEIPIFAPLREVLEARKGAKGEQLVFPDAARMLSENPQGLSWRFKCLVARALGGGGDVVTPSASRVPLVEIAADGVAAIQAKLPEGARRERILDVFRRYCGGRSVRQIEQEIGCAKATVSADLHLVQEALGKQILPFQPSSSISADIARLTRAGRERGQRAASIRDWHALRTTYVTLALSAGVPVELVRRVTGHATVDIVLENYFRPDREQFKSALNLALPEVLTGGATSAPTPAEELRSLTDKVTAGIASAADRKRLRVVAAMV